MISSTSWRFFDREVIKDKFILKNMWICVGPGVTGWISTESGKWVGFIFIHVARLTVLKIQSNNPIWNRICLRIERQNVRRKEEIQYELFPEIPFYSWPLSTVVKTSSGHELFFGVFPEYTFMFKNKLIRWIRIDFGFSKNFVMNQSTSTYCCSILLFSPSISLINFIFFVIFRFQIRHTQSALVNRNAVLKNKRSPQWTTYHWWRI